MSGGICILIIQQCCCCLQEEAGVYENSVDWLCVFFLLFYSTFLLAIPSSLWLSVGSVYK